jgi:hypothetical protein
LEEAGDKTEWWGSSGKRAILPFAEADSASWRIRIAVRQHLDLFLAFGDMQKSG